MASWIVPPIYAAVIWWFSTGAVLLLVGRWGRSDSLRLVSATILLVGALFGLALTANDVSVGAAYMAFTCTILLWGAQEIAFLTGWITGPRPRPCPAGVEGWMRLSLALQAILYHELALLACGGAIVALTWNGSNRVGLWTFAALWVLRQSAKINLFLGVPVTNDELMPEPVQFLKTFFARKPVGAFFPLSVTLATGVLVIMIQRIVEVAVTPFDVVGLTLVSTLFALGVVEHWFMLLPLPAITLWGWGMRSPFPPEDNIMVKGPDAKPAIVPPNLVVLSSVRPEAAPAKTQSHCARQRLEDQFRQRFLEQHARNDLPAALGISVEPAATVNGRTS
jgi:putative photosynthetic complex assembly protein 2